MGLGPYKLANTVIRSIIKSIIKFRTPCAVAKYSVIFLIKKFSKFNICYAVSWNAKKQSLCTPGGRGRAELTHSLGHFSWENPEIFYFPYMIKYANFEFILAIRGLTITRSSVVHKINFSSTK